jgi:CHASE1-domain containing sensor protein
LYENLLRGSAGLVTVNPNLTQDDWTAYQNAYNIPKNYPAVQGAGVSRFLTKDEVSVYIEQRHAAGDPGFQIFPEGDRDIYAPAAFSARYNDSTKNALGYDAYSEPTRRTAMERAVESNSMTMTGKVQLLTETDPKQSAFVLYYPVYKRGLPLETAAQRKSALWGFVSLGIDSKVFSDLILQSNRSPNIAWKAYDAEAVGGEKLSYQSDTFDTIAQRAGAKQQSVTSKVNNHTWRVVYAAAPELVSARERQLPEQALWRGLVTCIFFAGLVWYLITDRERKYARQKREEVQTAKDDLLSLASHQLRTPATVVKQYVGMLLQGYGGKLSDQQLSMLDNAYSSNERQLTSAR